MMKCRNCLYGSPRILEIDGKELTLEMNNPNIPRCDKCNNQLEELSEPSEVRELRFTENGWELGKVIGSFTNEGGMKR